MDREQLTFGFKTPSSYENQDFAIFSSNQSAYKWIQSWPNWKVPGLVLVGPSGSGKTHLAYILKHKSRGEVLSFDDLHEGLLEQLEFLPTTVIIENCNKWSREKEVILFHLYNHLLKNQGTLILTSLHPVDAWPLVLPDFKSRVKTLAEVIILDPEDDLLLAILIKRFADHQIKVDFKIAEFLIKRIPRTYVDLHRIMDFVLKKALQQKKRITIPFLKSINF